MKIHEAAERETIRAKLLAFAQRNSIGVPTLALHIARRLKLTPEQVPVKSLQRFLRGEGRTNDALVAHCARFAEQEGRPDDKVADLGRALAGAMGVWQNASELDGTIYFWNDNNKEDMGAIGVKILSILKWREVDGYVRVQERQLKYLHSNMPMSRITREGVGVSAGGCEYFVVTDAMQQTTRTITISRQPDEFGNRVVRGQAVQTGGSRGIGYDLSPANPNDRRNMGEDLWEYEQESGQFSGTE